MSDAPELVGLTIGGTEWRGFSDLEVKYSIDACGTFSFTSPFEAERTEFRNAFKPFSYQSVQLDTNGDWLCDGTMFVEPNVDANAREVAVSGYSLPGVLGDCTMPESSLPIGFRGQTLAAIAQTIADAFGLRLVIEGAGSETVPFDDAKMEATETPFAFLSKLAQQRTMCVSDTRDGALRLWTPPTTGTPVASFVYGQQPATSIKPTFKSQEMFSEVTGLKSANGGRAGARWTERNPFLAGVNRPLMFAIDDADKGDVQSATIAKLGRMIGNAITVSVEVPTWRDQNGALWQPNAMVTIDAPQCMIYTPSDFVIRDVTLKQAPDSTTATLECVLPGAFSGEIPASVPWA